MTRDELLAAYKEGKRDFHGANLRNADLRGADLRRANLSDTDLGGADLRGADLRGADLRYANLIYADLRDANLIHVNLRGANLGKQWIIQGSIRSDSYQFMLTNFTNEGVRLKAGCRNFTMIEAYDHWTKTKGGTKLGDETIAILDNLWQLAWIRGYLDSDGKWIGELK